MKKYYSFVLKVLFIYVDFFFFAGGLFVKFIICVLELDSLVAVLLCARIY